MLDIFITDVWSAITLTDNIFKEARYKIIQNDGFSWKKSHTIITLWLF